MVVTPRTVAVAADLHLPLALTLQAAVVGLHQAAQARPDPAPDLTVEAHQDHLRPAVPRPLLRPLLQVAVVQDLTAAVANLPPLVPRLPQVRRPLLARAVVLQAAQLLLELVRRAQARHTPHQVVDQHLAAQPLPVAALQAQDLHTRLVADPLEAQPVQQVARHTLDLVHLEPPPVLILLQ